MPDIKCQCENCTGTLHPLPEAEAKGRKNVFACGRCGCVYGFIVITRTPKCFSIIEKNGKKKRGRPKDPIKVLHESMEENKEVLEALSHGHLKRRGRPKKTKPSPTWLAEHSIPVKEN